MNAQSDFADWFSPMLVKELRQGMRSRLFVISFLLLQGALIFVAITASFYSSLAARVPGLDPSDPAVRAAIVPLNPPKGVIPADQAAASREASVDAFHLAALTSAGLLVAGAVANGVGLRSRRATKREGQAAAIQGT